MKACFACEDVHYLSREKNSVVVSCDGNSLLSVYVSNTFEF